MATTSVKMRRPSLLAATDGAQTSGEATEPKLRAVKLPPAQKTPPSDPREIQRQAIVGTPGEDLVNVRLLINGSDDDGIRAYDEQVPISLLRAILDPGVGDFFIPIAGTARTKPPRTKAHFLHTNAIREILILDAYPVFEDA